MSIFSKLITLFRGTAHEAGAAVVDANALRILDQEIRDADNALARARDDLATLVAKRRMTEKEVQNLKDQSSRYENSARAALSKGDEALATEVATRIAELEGEIALKTPQLADMRTAEERMHQTIAQTQGSQEAKDFKVVVRLLPSDETRNKLRPGMSATAVTSVASIENCSGSGHASRALDLSPPQVRSSGTRPGSTTRAGLSASATTCCGA